tara:strand:+ start:37857 stop:38693 length:837 start_codon:yes stop_codon:yes gene_type:complete
MAPPLTYIPANDRGLAYGDGVFETLRLSASGAPLRALHKERMRQGAARLSIPFDGETFDRYLDALIEEKVEGANGASSAAAQQSGVAKIILTRGSGGRGYAAPAAMSPRWITQRFPFVSRPARQRDDGLALGLCREPVADLPSLAGLKHLNRLDQVLAQQQVSAAGWDEGMLLDQRGRPLELTSMNLFFRFANELFTPDLRSAGVAGVARAWCLQHASSHGVTCRQQNVSLSRLREADEVFACNSVAGILPVRKLALWQWPVGKLARSLQREFDALFV